MEHERQNKGIGRKARTRQWGFSLIEVVMGSFIAVLTVWGSITLLSYFWRSLRAIRVHNSELAYVNELRANISANPQAFFVSPDPKEYGESSIVPATFSNPPFAFDVGKFETRANCTDCPATMGYAIYPMRNVPGAYELEIVVKYPAKKKERTYRSVIRR